MAEITIRGLIQIVWRVTVIFNLVSLPWIGSRGEKFTALKDLEKVLHAENTVAQDLRRYVEVEQIRLQKLTEIADDFESHSSVALEDPIHHLGNPVNAFLLVKRFTTEWDHILSTYVRSQAADSFIDGLNSRTSLFPDAGDYDGAAMALMRLQDTYALPTEKIVQGDLLGVHDSPHLSAADCFELGKVTYNHEDYYHTVMWMSQALQLLDDGSPLNGAPPPRGELLDYLSYAAYMQGNKRMAYNLTIEWLREEPTHIRAQNNLRFYEGLLAQEAASQSRSDLVEEEFRNERKLHGYQVNEDFQTYEKLCRGEETHERPDKHKLFCSFRQHHPIFYLRPLREEIMNFQPWIAVYHNVLTESEMEKIKELASPRLARSVVYHDASKGAKSPSVQDYRVSKTAWLFDEEHAYINRMSQRTSALTNLTLESVEEFQVVNYGIGGHYEPHYDFARKEEISTFTSEDGNRILTAIYYLTDVDAGGYTVFPAIGVHLKPEKGACAVWYNLLKSGEGDFNTRHAGCPVLTGTKWISNKWFHERGQEWVRPCGLKEEE